MFFLELLALGGCIVASSHYQLFFLNISRFGSSLVNKYFLGMIYLNDRKCWANTSIDGWRSLDKKIFATANICASLDKTNTVKIVATYRFFRSMQRLLLKNGSVCQAAPRYMFYCNFVWPLCTPFSCLRCGENSEYLQQNTAKDWDLWLSEISVTV